MLIELMDLVMPDCGDHMIMNCCVADVRASFRTEATVTVVGCPDSDVGDDVLVVSYQYYKNAGIFAQFLIA